MIRAARSGDTHSSMRRDTDKPKASIRLDIDDEHRNANQIDIYARHKLLRCESRIIKFFR